MRVAAPRSRALRPKLLVTVVVLSLMAAVGLPGVYSAFVANTKNTGDTFASGTVDLTDNDSGNAMLALSAAQPGDSDSGCLKVSYSGSLPSTLRLYGTTTGTGLDAYLDLKVTRGTYSGAQPGFDSCTNFQPDSTNYTGAGAGVVYDGTLAGYPDSFGAGLVDPTSGSPATWTNGDAKVYKLEVRLRSDTAAQGKNATQTFTWEARNQ